MDAPKCRLCGKAHWPREGCTYSAPDDGSGVEVFGGEHVPDDRLQRPPDDSDNFTPAEGCDYGEKAHRSEVLSPDPDEAGEHFPPSPRNDVPGNVHDGGEDVPGVIRVSPAERSRLWRKANRERYNAQKRAQMRRKRAEERKKR